MKQFLHNLTNSKHARFYKLLLLALIIRLVLLPLSFHSDLNNNEIWGIYAEEFGLNGFYDWLNFGNYARPDYPPLSMILFLQIRKIWEVLFSLLWAINVGIKIFPSFLMTWYDQLGNRALLKLPGVISDVLFGFFVYKHVLKTHNKKIASRTASLILFNPALIYLSSSWGQLDPAVTFFAYLAIVLLLQKKYALSLTAYFTSIMIKATYLPLSLLLAIKAYKQKITIKTTFLLAVLTALYLFLLGNPFTPSNPLKWLIDLYLNKIIKGAVTLPFINLNAFNFWGLVLGLERIKDSSPMLGIPLYIWAYVMSTFFILLITKKYIKGANIYFATIMLFFAIFMFFPRVHERYLYPAVALFPLVLIQYPKLLKIYITLSVVFLLNLYHWWWFPNVSFLVSFFDLDLVERSLSLLNLLLFFTMLKHYLSAKITK